MTVATTLIVLGKIWLWAVAALILLGYVSIWWFEGFSKLQQVLNPFNVWNVIAVVLTLAPGFGLIKLGERIRERHLFLMDRWKERGIDKRFPSCIIIEEIARVADERNEARRIPVFENWLLIFDEIANWFSALALALEREFLTAEPEACGKKRTSSPITFF
jgi:hypothetical protein